MVPVIGVILVIAAIPVISVILVSVAMEKSKSLVLLSFTSDLLAFFHRGAHKDRRDHRDHKDHKAA